MNILIRLLEFATRFIVGIHNFGLAGAIKVFLLYRSQSLLEPAYIYLKKPNQRFYFRGASDRGVISHFYKAGYRITDEKSVDKISFIIDAEQTLVMKQLVFDIFILTPQLLLLNQTKRIFNYLKKTLIITQKPFALIKGYGLKNVI